MPIVPDAGPWPYIDDSNDLVIPTDCDERFKFWEEDWGGNMGMSLADVCRYIDAPDSVVAKYEKVQDMPSRGSAIDVDACLEAGPIAAKVERTKRAGQSERLL